MANNNNIPNYTALDIEKYHKGELSATQMNQLEKAALDDPFLADALEGYRSAGPSLKADLDDLSSRLQQKTSKGAPVIPMSSREFSPVKKNISWLRIAVMIAVIAGAALLANQFLFNNKPADIADNNSKNPTPETTIEDTSHNFTPPVSGDVAKSTPTPENIEKPSVKPEKKKIVAEELNDGTPVPGTPVTTNNDIAAAEKKNIVNTAPPSSTNQKPQPITRKDEDVARRSMEESVVKEGTDDAKQRESANRNVANNYRNIAKTFRGRVTDNSRAGVPFANVTNIDDNVGTYTDANGYFNLTSPDSVLQVQIRSIGFENTITELRNDLPANEVVLKDDNKELTAIVLQRQKPNAASRAQNRDMYLEESEPADGWDNYDSYLANNLKPPRDIKPQQRSTGSVELSFEVDKNGEPTKFKIEKSLCAACDKEAIRLVKEGPRWKKNLANGRTRVTINF